MLYNPDYPVPGLCQNIDLSSVSPFLIHELMEHLKSNLCQPKHKTLVSYKSVSRNHRRALIVSNNHSWLLRADIMKGLPDQNIGLLNDECSVYSGFKITLCKYEISTLLMLHLFGLKHRDQKVGFNPYSFGSWFVETNILSFTVIFHCIIGNALICTVRIKLKVLCKNEW